MKKYREKEVIKTEKVLETAICDICKIDINQSDNNHFYEVTTHHSRWGNDSVDSYDYYDFCSYDCLTEHMNRFFTKDRGTDVYEIERIDR